jgi:hypothetical protein
METGIELFFAYAHEDGKLRKKLERHLSLLKRQGLIASWYDREIIAGMQWENEIDTHLDTAHIILLLVSADFLASDYCYSVEMKRALERNEAKQARVIPIILRPVYWRGAPFGKLQALPTGAEAVTSSSWHNQDEAFVDVVLGIQKVVELLIAKPIFSSAMVSNTVSVDPRMFRHSDIFTNMP